MGRRTRSKVETIYEPRLANVLDRFACERNSVKRVLADITVGIQVYHRRKVSKEVIKARAFHATTKKGADWYRYINGNEVQRYFQVPSETAYLKYSDDLCDKRELAHYRLPRFGPTDILEPNRSVPYQAE